MWKEPNIKKILASNDQKIENEHLPTRSYEKKNDDIFNVKMKYVSLSWSSLKKYIRLDWLYFHTNPAFPQPIK